MGSIKWIIFIIGLGGLLPLIKVLRSNPPDLPWVWVLMGFFPFMLSAAPNLVLSAIAWPTWPGSVKGLQISALDLYAFAIYVTLPRAQRPVPFRLSMIFYFLVVGLSTFFAQVPLAA